MGRKFTSNLISLRFFRPVALLVFFQFSTFSLLAQKEIKFGKYSQEELELKEVEFEPEANAVVLKEYSRNRFLSGVLENKIHRRVKILKESGKSEGDVKISFYYGEGGVQKIQKLNAQITNFVNGIEKTYVLNESEFYTVNKENGFREIRFTFPDVAVGSILEYEYLMRDIEPSSKLTWVFQNPIPTIQSEYFIDIPSFTSPYLVIQGDKALAADFKSNTNGVYNWNLTNLRSIKKEPLVYNVEDYFEKVEFVFRGFTQFGSWKEFSDYFINLKEVSSYLDPNSKDIEFLQSIQVEGKTEIEKAKKLHRIYLDSLKLNFDPDQELVGLPKFLKTKKGSVIDQNLGLIALFQAHGIKAEPILINKKGSGRANLLETPYSDQFNGMIIRIFSEGKEYFGDATSLDYPFGYVPNNFRVNTGFLLGVDDPKLIPLNHLHRSGISQVVTVSTDSNQTFVSDATMRFTDYDAIAVSWLKEAMEKKQLLSENFSIQDENILDYSFSEKNENRKIVDIKIKASVGSLTEDLIFISPFKYSRWMENPLKEESRSFPVDFSHTFTDNYTSIIEVPKGYEVDDYPEDANITIPGGTAIFTYQVSQWEGQIKITTSLNLKYPLVSPTVYSELKYFMELVTTKLKEPVVLKKTANP